MRTRWTLVVGVVGIACTMVAVACAVPPPPTDTTTTTSTSETTTSESTTTAAPSTTTTSPPPPPPTGVTLASPWPSFGNNFSPGCHSTSACPIDENGNPQPLMWAAIQYPYTSHQNGDPYTTRCWGDSSTMTTCTNPPMFDNAANGAGTGPGPTNPVFTGSMAQYNPEYQPDGHLFAIDVREPGSVEVQVYDGSCDASGSDSGSGDASCANTTPTDFQVYDPSSSQATIDASPGHELAGCRATAWADDSLYKNRWATICTLDAPAAGVYPLRVRTDDIPAAPDISFAGCLFTDVQTSSGCRGNGWNSFALRATGAGAQVHAIDRMSVWTNLPGVTSFDLADVEPTQAGKRVQLDLFDPGDGSSGYPYTISVKAPDAAGNAGVQDIGCDWARSDTRGGTPNLLGSSAGSCSIVTRGSTVPYSRFNNEWIRVTVTVPDTYTCPADSNQCWWRLLYTYPAGAAPTDRTVWAVAVVDAPSPT